VKLMNGFRRTRGAILAALVALLMLGAAIPASADPGTAKAPASITGEKLPGGGAGPRNITWD
jgi:hypothetical protein